MNTEFENHSRVTLKILREFGWNQSKGTKLMIRIVVAMYMVGLAAIIYLTIRDGLLHPTNAMLLFFGSCMMLYLWYGPHSAAKRTMKSVREACDGEIPDTVLTFGEEIVSDSPMGWASYDYDQILQVMSLKHSYILLMDNKKGLPVNRTGFTKGSFEEFKQFLREKRPDLTIPE